MAANLAIYESTAKHTWSLLLSSLALLQYRTYDLSAHRSDLAALRHFEGSVALSTTCPRHSHRLRLGVEPNSRSTALCVTKATEQHHIGVIDGPSFKRCAPLGMWQRSSTRTYHMPCIASQRLPAPIRAARSTDGDAEPSRAKGRHESTTS